MRIIFALLLSLVAGGLPAEPTGPLTLPPLPEKPLPPDLLLLTGEVRAVSAVSVCSKVMGRLDEIKVAEGDPVVPGQVLAVIDHRLLSAQAAAARAAVAVAKASLTQMEAGLEASRRDFERYTALLKEGSATEQQFDQVKSRFAGLQAQQALVQAQIAQAQAGSEAAEASLAEATIQATIPGVVTKKFFDQGDHLTATGKALFSLANLDQIKIVVNVPERDRPRVVAGGKATISVESVPGRTFNGTVAKVYPSLVPETRTAEVEILLPNPDHELRPGMYASVALPVKAPPALPAPEAGTAPGKKK